MINHLLPIEVEVKCDHIPPAQTPQAACATALRGMINHLLPIEVEVK
jgi:hypothetical protein